MTPHDAQERSAAAGEFVLGTLNREERAAFELELQRDRALLAKVYFWQDQLVHLTSRVPPEEPDIELWPAIESPLAPPAGVVRRAR